MFIEGRHGPEVDPDLASTLRSVSPATLGHFTDFGFTRGLRPNRTHLKVVGGAVTVRIPHLDATAVHCVMDVVRPGDVIVVDQSGDMDRACWGGGMSYVAQLKGAEGVIVDGAVTDVDEIDDLGPPVFFRSVSALTTRLLGIEGAINVPGTVGGVTVCPGDVIFADENGVAVLTVPQAEHYAPLLVEREAAGPEVRRRLSAGESLADISGARKLFEANCQRAVT